VATAVSALEVEAGGASEHLAGEACRDELQAHIVPRRLAARVAARRGLAPRVARWLLHQKTAAGFCRARPASVMQSMISFAVHGLRL